MLKTTKYIENRLFDGLFVNKRKCLQKIWKKMVAIWSWYFHPAFERRFSDFPFSRSLRHKITTFDAYVEKERKLDGTRDKLGCGMRCEAGSNIDERANISAIEYGNFSEKTCFRAVGFDYLFLSIQWKKKIEWQSISWSRKVGIEIFITRRPLSTHVNLLLKKTIDWSF